jgi:heme oxygenase
MRWVVVRAKPGAMSNVTVTVKPVERSAASLREATLDVHQAAEQEPFIASLMAGERSADDLARLTGQLRSIYAALEVQVRAMRDREELLALLDPRLDRLAAIESDLATLAGPAARRLTRALPATRAYVTRIAAVGGDRPRLLAHHYVRYLGDLSGGQIIAKLMRDHYGVGDDALHFYDFDDLEGKGAFKRAYRRELDALFADPAFYEAMLDETRLAYEANRRVFRDLGAVSPAVA